MPTNQREHGAPENVLNQEPVNQQNTQQPVAWRNAVKLLVSEYWDIAFRQGKTGANLAGKANDALFHLDTLLSNPPVPRDALMAFGHDVAEKAWCAGMKGETFTDIAALADRYASQVQPERCQCCGYLVTESEHKGCLRAGRAANAPEPVNQQMRDALEAIAVAEIFDPLASAVAMQTMARGTLNAIAAAEAAQSGHIGDTDKMVHAVPDVLEQLQLAETEVINAKAWSVGEQAKTHCKHALTAIAVARSLLYAAQKQEGV